MDEDALQSLASFGAWQEAVRLVRHSHEQDGVNPSDEALIAYLLAEGYGKEAWLAWAALNSLSDHRRAPALFFLFQVALYATVVDQDSDGMEDAQVLLSVALFHIEDENPSAGEVYRCLTVWLECLQARAGVSGARTSSLKQFVHLLLDLIVTLTKGLTAVPDPHDGEGMRLLQAVALIFLSTLRSYQYGAAGQDDDAVVMVKDCFQPPTSHDLRSASPSSCRDTVCASFHLLLKGGPASTPLERALDAALRHATAQLQTARALATSTVPRRSEGLYLYILLREAVQDFAPPYSRRLPPPRWWSLSSFSSLMHRCPAVTAAALGAPSPLRWMEAAMDRGDWAAALEVGYAAVMVAASSSPSVVAGAMEPLHFLRKGLTACERAATRGAAWHGAMALWRYWIESQQGNRGTSGESRERGGGATPDSAERRALGRIFALLADGRRWAEALYCFEHTPASFLDGFIISQVAYALRKSPGHDADVLPLWAMWRCRVGDAAVPTEGMVEQLLHALLHTPLPSVKGDKSPAKAATQLLIAAARQSTERPPEPHSDGAETPVRNPTRGIQGALVPLRLSRNEKLIACILRDRWTGSWADALSVSVASGSQQLLRLTAILSPPHEVVYAATMKAVHQRGIQLDPIDHAALAVHWADKSNNPTRAGGKVGSSQQPMTISKYGTDSGVTSEATTTSMVRRHLSCEIVSVETFLDDLFGEES